MMAQAQTSFVALIPAVLVGLGLLAGWVVLMVKGGRAGRIIGVCLPLMALVGLAAMLSWVRGSHEPRVINVSSHAVAERAAPQLPESQRAAAGWSEVAAGWGEVAAGWGEVAAGWDEVAAGWAEAPGMADVYPSTRSAADAIGRWVALQLPPADPAVPLSVVGTAPEDVRHAILAAVIREAARADPILLDEAAFTAAVPRPALEVSYQPNGSAGPTLAVRLHENAPDSDRGSGSTSAHMQIVDRPWVDSMNDTSNGPAIGFSTDLHSDRASALAQAREQAVRALAARAAATAPDAVSEHAAAGAAEQLCVAQSWPTDAFVQRFERPYGSVYRAAVRMDVPPDAARLIVDRVTGRAAHAEAAAQERHDWRRNRSLAGVALIGSLLAIYVVLNALTKGYHARRL